jgi:hypothetical protein
MSKHNLYYSTRCRFCQAFMEELARTPYVPEFQLICVDPRPGRPPLPAWLKSVPSLWVAGEDTPRIGPGPVNNWLFERKNGGGVPAKSASAMMEDRRAPLTPPVYNPEMAPRAETTGRAATASTARGGGSSGALPAAISSATPANSSMGPPVLAGSSDGPMAFHFGEMSGNKLSDSYSFLSAPEFTADKGFNPISKNFELLGGPSAGGFGGAAPAAAAHKPSAKEAKLLSDFERYTADRDRDIPGPPTRK